MLKIATCTGDAPRPPYSSRPVDPDPAVGRELGLPLPAERRPRRRSTRNAAARRRARRATPRTSAANASSSAVKLRSTSEVPEAFALVVHERALQRRLVVGGERPVGRRRRGRARRARRRRRGRAGTSGARACASRSCSCRWSADRAGRARSGVATSARSPSCASSQPANATGSKLGAVGQHEAGHHLVAGLVVGDAVDRREHDAGRVAQRLLDRARRGSSRRRRGSSRRCGRRSRGSRRRPCSRGRPTSTSRRRVVFAVASSLL